MMHAYVSRREKKDTTGESRIHQEIDHDFTKLDTVDNDNTLFATKLAGNMCPTFQSSQDMEWEVTLGAKDRLINQCH